jgi:metal-sulfur cluster biosynthetic enzyme
MRKRVAEEVNPEMGRMGAEDPSTPPQHPATVSADRLWAALAEIQDPEMPVNLVDLGVIYGIAEKDGIVDVDLTFTAMGCPASDFILEDVRERLLREVGIQEVRVNVVWDPPWTAARITQDGRDALEAWGLAV